MIAASGLKQLGGLTDFIFDGSFVMSGILIAAVVIFLFLASGFKVLNEYERGVVMRLGKFAGIKGPGLVIVIPILDTMLRVELRTITMDVPPQDVITRDNVTIKVNAVVYFRVIDPEKAVFQVQDYYFATSQLAQTTLRSVLGQVQMDELLSNRDAINQKLQDILDNSTDSWGIKVSAVEVKQIDLPESMQKAMAREAEAERERRAKLISADGELQRAAKLAEASHTLSASPSALQLAYLQTLSEISTGSGKTSTIIFPIPMDFIKPFMERLDAGSKPVNKA
jgi:regulator of protease activity HflC (stomatin/prohibitin superfamily)